MTYQKICLGLRLFFLITLVGFIIVCWCFAEDAPQSYSEVLKKTILEASIPDIKGRFRIPTGRIVGRPFDISVDYRPIKGLESPDAVPFLIDVMINGPDWEDKQLLTMHGGILPHLARCIAASNLGAHKDPRAYEPLLEMLNKGDFLEEKYHITYFEKNKYDIKKYAAEALGILGDPRGIDPLIAAIQNDECAQDIKQEASRSLGYLRDPNAVDFLVEAAKNKKTNKSLRWESIKSLSRIRDMRTVPIIIEIAEEIGEADTMHDYLAYMTKVEFNLKYSREDRAYTVREFPELGKIDSSLKVWRHWLNIGKKYTEDEFQKQYSQWHTVKQTRSEEKAAIKNEYRKMLKFGVASLPLMIEKISQGELALIPAVSELTNRNLKEDATQDECLQWWKKNKQRWLIPFKKN